MKEKTKIYTSENCLYCKQVKDILTENDYKFKEVDAKHDSMEWQKVIATVGLASTPVLLYKNVYLVPGRDFQDENHLVSILNGFTQIHVTPSIELILERLKTIAFQFGSNFAGFYTDMQAIKTKLNIENQGFNAKVKEDEHESTD